MHRFPCASGRPSTRRRRGATTLSPVVGVVAMLGIVGGIVSGMGVGGTAVAAASPAPPARTAAGAATDASTPAGTTPAGASSADVVDENGRPIQVTVPTIGDDELAALPAVMRLVALARRDIDRANALIEAARLAAGRAEGAVGAQRVQVEIAREQAEAVHESVRERQAALQSERARRTKIAVAAYTSAETLDVDLDGHDLPNLQTIHYSNEVMQVATQRVARASADVVTVAQQLADARAVVDRSLQALAHVEQAAERARAGQLLAAQQRETAQGAFDDAKAAALAAYDSSGRALVSDLTAAGYVNGSLPATALVAVEDRCALETRAAASWNRMRAAAAADGVLLGGGSCYRSSGEQTLIYATATPGFAARPGFSMHGWGRAIDVDAGGGFVTSFADRAWLWVRANGMRFGWVNPDVLGPASDTPEPWHIEWTGADPSEVESAAQTGAIPGATATAAPTDPTAPKV